MKKTNLILPLLALGIALLSSCSKLNVKSDFAGETFSDYQRYGWHSSASEDQSDLERLVHMRVVALVDEALAVKGYRQSDSADFLVSYQVTAEVDFDVKQLDVYSGYGPGFVWRPGEGVSNEVMVSGKEVVVDEVRKGTLIIDIIDAKTDKLVWRSVADKEFDGQLTQEQRDTELKAAIKKIFKGIPSAR